MITVNDLYGKNFFDWTRKSSNYRPKIQRLISNLFWYYPETKKVLDVGCGHGFLVKALLKKGIEAFGVDFSQYAGEEIPNNFFISNALILPIADNEFDVVISSDFFEHLREEDIDQVYSEMKRVGKNVMALISFKGKEPSHLTVKPRGWWEKKLPGCIIIKTFNERKNERI